MVRLCQILIAVYLRQSLKHTFSFLVFCYGPSISFSFDLRKDRLRYEFVEAWWCRGWDITLLVEVGYQWINHCVSG